MVFERKKGKYHSISIYTLILHLQTGSGIFLHIPGDTNVRLFRFII